MEKEICIKQLAKEKNCETERSLEVYLVREMGSNHAREIVSKIGKCGKGWDDHPNHSLQHMMMYLHEVSTNFLHNGH